tara:strand:+ start:924 stop:1703 length:780 start_codon:yes stop_codon:yes gene_type:complete
MSLLKKQSLKNWPYGNNLGWFLIPFYVIVLCTGFKEDPKNPWVMIDGGKFTMGSEFCRVEQGNSDWCSDEIPHTVRLEGFAIHRYEVTNDEYYGCFKAGFCSPNDLHEFRPKDFNRGKQPVTFVSWDQAVDFCEWVGGRLPTEAEWEFSANTEILGGAYFGQKYDEGAPRLAGGLEFNSRGLFDMLGNVYEWTGDWYGPYEKSDKQINPKGPAFGKERVVRGGSWNSPAHFIRATDRIARRPEYRYSDVGFRCVKPLDS